MVYLLSEKATEVYKPYVRSNNKVNKILILRLLNAMYGKMVEILLYYPKFFKTILVAGFKLNTYDKYSDNWMVNGMQQQKFWHMNSCKLRQVDPKVNEKLIEELKQEY